MNASIKRVVKEKPPLPKITFEHLHVGEMFSFDGGYSKPDMLYIKISSHSYIQYHVYSDRDILDIAEGSSEYLDKSCVIRRLSAIKIEFSVER